MKSRNRFDKSNFYWCRTHSLHYQNTRTKTKAQQYYFRRTWELPYLLEHQPGTSTLHFTSLPSLTCKQVWMYLTAPISKIMVFSVLHSLCLFSTIKIIYYTNQQKNWIYPWESSAKWMWSFISALPNHPPEPQMLVLQEKEKACGNHIIRRTNGKGKKMKRSFLPHTILWVSELLVEKLNLEEQFVQLLSAVHCHSSV